MGLVYFIGPILLGWLAGLSTNYLSESIPYTRAIRRPVCEDCGEAQPWYAFLIWPRVCYACASRRKSYTFAIELLFIVLSVFFWTSNIPIVEYLIVMLLSVYLGSVMLIDIKHHIILHETSAFGAIFGLYSGWWFGGIKSALIGCAVGLGLMLGVYYAAIGASKVLDSWKDTVVSTDDTPIGFGDVLLTGVLGLIVGWPGIIFAILVSVYAGGMVGLVYLLGMAVTGKEKKEQKIFLPLAPFLIFGLVICKMVSGP